MVSSLNLTVLTPETTLVEKQPILSMVACGEEGFFGVLPKHQPLLAALKPSVLEYKTLEGVKQSVTLPTAAILSTDGQDVTVLCQ